MDEKSQKEKTATAADERRERIASLNALAWDVGASDPRRALALSEQAYALAREAGDKTYHELLLTSVVNLARFHYELSQLDRAQACLDEALLLAQNHAQVHADEVSPGHKQSLSRIYLGKGLVSWRLGDYALALEHLLTALDLVRSLGDRRGEVSLLSNIGMVYGVIGEYAHAMDVYRQALDICSTDQEHGGHALALNNMAMVCIQAEQYEKALDFARRSLHIARKIGHRSAESNALDSAGAAYLGLGRLDEAFRHFEGSAALAAELGDRHDELAAWIHMGQVYARQQETTQAQRALQRALALAQELADTEQMRHCYQELARLYKEQGQFVQALAHYELFHEADRAIYRERADMRFKTLQVMHETETARQEAEIAQLRNASLQEEIEVRRRIEAALRESEERFRLLMEESPIGVHIYAPDGRLLHVNRAWNEMWPAGDDAGKTFNVLQSEIVERLGLRDAVWRAFEGQPVRLPEIEVNPQLLGTQGPSRWLRAQAYSLVDEDRQLKNVVFLIEDVTEQRRSEEALRHTQKMESLGALAGGVAHDFNNLLVAMLGQATLALKRLAEDAPARAHVIKVVFAAEQAAELTQQMLAYSGRGHFAIRPLDLNVLIQEHAHLWQAAVSRNVTLELALAPSLPTIEADAGQLQQMILNLILNGAEAMGQTGRIMLRTQAVELKGHERRFWRYTGRPLTAGAYLQLDVADDATGIAPENLAHIFDPFFTTKEQGRGLGLAAVLGIVRGHSAGLAVGTNEWGGTTFEVVFPVSAARLSEAGKSKRPAQSGAVLVIDDEEMVREAVADILLLEEMSVLVAEDGRQGVELYRQHAGEVALVLLDLSMPGMSGQETYHQLREIDPDVRVLLSSGFSASDIVGQFRGQEPAGFLQKPYSFAALVDEIRRHIDR